GFDAGDPMQTASDAQVFLDVGSELVIGAAGVLELTPRIHAAAEAQVFLPLPAGASWGDCRRYSGARCQAIDGADYFADAKRGDLTVLATAGAMFRLSADVTANVMVGSGQVGSRGDDVRFTTGLVWSPQPAGVAAPGRNDKDGDRIPDSIDACVDEAEDPDSFEDEDGCPELDNDRDGLADTGDKCAADPEDKDGFEDADGCPEPDNDQDAILDVTDRCAEQPEDRDGFEDEDGCPDDDNDGDGFADAKDSCPNDAETVNGVDDDDGCPDVRGTAGVEERPDRLDLKGSQLSFARAALTAQGKRLLDQVATIMKSRRLTIRVEVHLPLGTKARGAAQVAAQKRRDKTLSQQRARAILDYLSSQGVAVQQLQAVGLGSDRPLGTVDPTDPANERVDFIKAQQGATP
ncbi:MAG: OmpA family protein, partial [Kofleriaceae bacterium]